MILIIYGYVYEFSFNHLYTRAIFFIIQVSRYLFLEDIFFDKMNTIEKLVWSFRSKQFMPKWWSVLIVGRKIIKKTQKSAIFSIFYQWNGHYSNLIQIFNLSLLIAKLDWNWDNFHPTRHFTNTWMNNISHFQDHLWTNWCPEQSLYQF